MLRSGVIAKKVGMTRLFMEDGKQIPVTVLQLDKLEVVANRTMEKDGYTAVQLGAGTAKAKRTSKAMRGHFAAAKVEPKRKVAEFRVAEENLIPVGEEIIPPLWPPLPKRPSVWPTKPPQKQKQKPKPLKKPPQPKPQPPRKPH